MSKHTPGPWMPAAKANSATNRHPAIMSDHGEVAKAVWQGSERATDANARLIAAAPDLLEALQRLVRRDEADGVNYTGDHPVALARVAIAKAEGTYTREMRRAHDEKYLVVPVEQTRTGRFT